MKINFNGFLKKATEGFPKEVCGMLYAKKIYSPEEEWFIFPCENVSEDPENEWIPSSKELAKIKKQADKLGLVKLGNIHTHPYFGDGTKKDKDFCGGPSEKDLYYANKFRDLVRIILLVEGKKVHQYFIHDKFGKKLNVKLEIVGK